MTFVQDIGLTPVGLTPAPGVHPDYLFARRPASGYPLRPSRGQLNTPGITLVPQLGPFKRRLQSGLGARGSKGAQLLWGRMLLGV